MTTDFDPTDFSAHLAEAQQSVLREQIEHRVAMFTDRRPYRFAAEGDPHPKVLDWCRRVYQGTETGALILMGGVGAGKTWSLWKAGETLIRNGWRGRYEVVDAYDIKDAMRDRGTDSKALVDTWLRADVLAVDDIGAVGMHDWDSDNLHKLINERWKHGRVTALTTNAPDLKPLVGPRVASRLADGATFVSMGDTDRRRSK